MRLRPPCTNCKFLSTDRIFMFSLFQVKCGVRYLSQMLGLAASWVSRVVPQSYLFNDDHSAPAQHCDRKYRLLHSCRCSSSSPMAKCSDLSAFFSSVGYLNRLPCHPHVSTLKSISTVSYETIFKCTYFQPGRELNSKLGAILRVANSKRLTRSSGQSRSGQIQ